MHGRHLLNADSTPLVHLRYNTRKEHQALVIWPRHINLRVLMQNPSPSPQLRYWMNYVNCGTGPALPEFPDYTA